MTDIEIARQHEMQLISEIAASYGVESELEMYGKYKAKVDLAPRKPRGKLILVTAINPTASGEGKTTVSIGLADGMKNIGKSVCLALREPSLGPVFGVKGGAAGGGYSQVVPMEDINLHFTGDLHAITAANNLLSAMIDNHLQQGNTLGINPKRISHRRCLDVNDRALRNIVIGLGNPLSGVTREEHFDITAASEVMAILCLACDENDLKKRLGNILVGYTYSGDAVFARDINAHEAMAILLADAIKPNIVQSLGGVMAFVHGGPFANIAHGCNSIVATRAALSVSDYVVTEAGFGADLGAEKFLDVKCRIAGFNPSAVVVVATVKALKLHGGANKDTLATENLSALQGGIGNLIKHIENMRGVYNMPVVVAINRFTTDTDTELAFIKDTCAQLGVDAIVSDVWGKGGKGAEELANRVVAVCDAAKNKLTFSYRLEDSIEKKINDIATKVYGADGADLSDAAKLQIENIKKLGYEKLPVIIAKTQYSLSDNMKLIGAPKNFRITVSDVMLKSGAGFIVAVCGNMMLMPGLPKVPAAEMMTIENGIIDGLF